ncbi:MAG: NAD-dependent epimerase/dehydratase family protein [Turicibacter sp.]
MRILVLGGTRFFGKKAVQCMIDKGYDVTIVTRGILKDDFLTCVNRINVDRTDALALKEALKDKSFDVVFDNICYAPNDIKTFFEIMGNRIGKYIVTSSLAVYEKGLNLVEEDFNPYTYEIKYGNRDDFSYGEGKRLVEAIAYQEYEIPTIAIRFPVVIGENDYTKRLAFYVEQVCNEKEFVALDQEEPMSFITEDEAGMFISELISSNFVGPINAASHGDITVKEIINIIENKTQKEAKLTCDSDAIGPYSQYGNATLNTTKALEIFDMFSDAKDNFEQVIDGLIN